MSLTAGYGITKPAAEETHKATRELGPGVVDNRLIWTSASGITRGDPRSDGGCLRKWWYEQCGDKRQPSTAAQAKGTKLHAEVEDNLLTGRPLRTQLAIAGRPFIPEGGPGLMIEASLTEAVDGKVTRSWLNVGPVVIAGHVDLWNHRGEYIDRESEVRRDAPNTLETKDWKTTSDFCYAKSPADLASNMQMMTYAEAGFRKWPQYEHARATHVYFLTRGRPQAALSTVLVDREHVGRKWEYAEGVVRTLADAAREKSADHVEVSRRACGAYGGCPHRTYCRVGSHNSLTDLFGERGAEDVLERFKQRQHPNEEQEDMSLRDKLLATTTVATLPAAEGVGVSINLNPVDAEVANLVAAEAARAAQRASLAALPVGFAAALQQLEESGRGLPMLTGRAAAAWATVKNTAAPGNGIAGSGWLGSHDNLKSGVEDPMILVGLAAEVVKLPRLVPDASPSLLGAPVIAAPAPSLAPPPAPSSVAVVPPDVPMSNPIMAADPIEGLNNAKTAAMTLASEVIPGLVESVSPMGPATAPAATVTTTPVITSSLIEPGTGVGTAPFVQTETAPAGAAVGPSAGYAGATIPAAPVKRGPGRPRKSSLTDKPEVATPAEGAATGSTISIFVDAIPSCEHESLTPYVEALAATVADYLKVDDVRSAPDKWRGSIAALARKAPPPPGCYTVDTRNEIAELVAVALELTCVETGGLYVRAR